MHRPQFDMNDPSIIRVYPEQVEQMYSMYQSYARMHGVPNPLDTQVGLANDFSEHGLNPVFFADKDTNTLFVTTKEHMRGNLH